MAQSITTCPASTRTSGESLLTHLLTLVVHTHQRVGQLSLLLDTRLSLEDPPVQAPRRGEVDAVPVEVQRAVLKQTLNDEMRRQLKLLSRTVNVLYDCTDRVTGLKLVKRARLPGKRRRS